MVGAAYYVAMRNEVVKDECLSHRGVGSVIDRLNTDTHNSRLNNRHFPTSFPYARDSLTPVVQQLAQREIFHVFSGKRRRVDRGLVLEEQWTTLDLPFAELRDAEADGRIPSLLVTPMAFSTGAKPFAQPLLISNLNVDSLAGSHWRYALPFFALFPETSSAPIRSQAFEAIRTQRVSTGHVGMCRDKPVEVFDGCFDIAGGRTEKRSVSERSDINWIDLENSRVISECTVSVFKLRFDYRTVHECGKVLGLESKHLVEILPRGSQVG